jgi:AraC-like DNA-binding protein
MSWKPFIHRPAPPLGCSIDHVWYNEHYQVGHRRERALPNGRFQLIIDLSGGFEPIVVGMQSEYALLETAALQHIMSVVFWPGGTCEFFDVPADAFYNDKVPLEQVWGADAPRLRDRLRDAPTPAEKFRVLDAALLRRRSQRRQLHAAVRHALGRFAHDAHIRSVLEVTKETGVSRRHLAQLFRQQVGITPKLYCRIHRFQRVVQRAFAGASVDWVEVALAGGYCDQAHLSNEFRDFSGMTPGDYLASDHPFANHVVED